MEHKNPLMFNGSLLVRNQYISITVCNNDKIYCTCSLSVCIPTEMYLIEANEYNFGSRTTPLPVFLETFFRPVYTFQTR